jgi:hypothetical protein
LPRFQTVAIPRRQKSAVRNDNHSLTGRSSLQFQPDIHKVIWRPRPGVLEVQAVTEFLGNRVYRCIELWLLIFLDEEGGIHDHFVADDLVVPRSHTHRAQSIVDFADDFRCALSQCFVDHAPELHAREVGGLQVLAGELVLKAVDLFILALQFFDNAITIPRNLESEFEFVGHLLEYVLERRINALEDFADVVVSAEHCTEAHRNDGVVLHHGFDYVLMRERILARGIEDEDGRLTHDGGNVNVMDRVNVLAGAADANLAEALGLTRFDYAIYIPSFLLLLLQARARLRGTFDRLDAVNFLSRFLLASNRRGGRLLLRFAGVHILPSKVCRSC